ncbi:MAG: hypothetical protein ABJF04_06345 [Reichenbachiella sp.]|uniref:hypothetical protein n=1 Tax=Reichenbachiella sp. TaxID=2184521 RepID=UPI003266E62C
MNVKNFGSKREIYNEGYLIAVKFVPSFPVKTKDNYSNLFRELEAEYSWRYGIASKKVKNIDGGATSVGFFLETFDSTQNGKLLGPRFILLPHETGLEVFIPLTDIAYDVALTYLGIKALDKIVDESLNLLLKVVKKRWSDLICDGDNYVIENVEIRTETKGVGIISIDEFEINQIRCLASNFHLINNIFDCNKDCFDGKMTQPLEEHPGYGKINPHSRD